ncbi:MAG TPA: GNAT family N-acetyltransferase [Myxococcota bacterium]|nr:GNAT family N-acetyltransferase [Myxococcota bacterium]
MIGDASPAWQIELLADRHVNDHFSCGKKRLDDYLKNIAARSMRVDTGRTFVAVREDSPLIRGYYTVAMSSIALEDLPDRKGLPNPVPTAIIGRLAVDQNSQRMGLGRLLLLDSLNRIVRASADVAAHAVFLHAIDDDARSFYLPYGFQALQDDPNHLFLPMTAVRKLCEVSSL